VTREIDLVEEVGRIHGLDRIPATLPRPEVPGGLTRAQALRRRVEDAMVGAGLHEAITVTLVPADDPDRYGLAADDPRRAVVRLDDPLTAELAVVRTTIVPSLLRAVRHNRNQGREDVALFEVAHLLRPKRPGAELPEEPWGLAFVLAGRLGGGSWRGPGLAADVLAAKGVLGVVLDRLGVPWSVEAAAPAHLTPGRAARVLVGGEPVGELGELHPQVAARFDLEGTVAIAEIDLDAVLARVPDRIVQRAVPAYPPVLQDVAVVVAADVPAAALLATAERAGAPLLRSATVFDRFADEARFGPGTVSLGLRLAFGADDRTLTEDEASSQRQAIVSALTAEHGARLRD
jgi:phenylalanyl-tRNA synthetase beta chain